MACGEPAAHGGARQLPLDIFHQLGELFLEAAPTVVIVFLFYLFLRWSFFTPILKVLKERKALLEGSRRDSEALRVRAQEKRRAYQDAMRQARATVFAEQEAVRRAAVDQRSTAIQQARSRANEEIQQAKKRIGAEIEAARGEVEASSQQLAEAIAEAVLEEKPLNLAGGAR